VDSENKPTESDWTGTGSYLVILSISNGQNSVSYIYTGGKTLAELQISEPQDMEKFPKYSISNTTSTIAFDQFSDVSDLMSN
jgi:hypothetical protein